MAKSSKEKVMSKLNSIESKLSPVVEMDRPRNRGFVSIDWEKKIIDGKKVVVYSCNHSGGLGKFDEIKKEYTDRDEFMKYVESKLEEIPGDEE